MSCILIVISQSGRGFKAINENVGVALRFIYLQVFAQIF